MLRTLFFFITFVPWTLFIIVTGIPLSFLSPDYLHTYSRLWGRVGLLLAGVGLRVEGLENLPAGQATIYMANHQSNFDILALFAGIPGQFRWLAKEELFHIPLFGLAMRRAGYIPIDRSDRVKAVQSMNEAARRIDGGTSVAIFPEGTRSPDGNLLSFKKGGFMLALKSGAPIVPVAICGSYEIMPKHSRWIQGGTIRVRVFPPLPTAGATAAERDRLMDEVRRSIATALEGTNRDS
jgi:1-acyl-sn-glycerol-3-phosphate acyltransferase